MRFIRIAAFLAAALLSLGQAFAAQDEIDPIADYIILLDQPPAFIQHQHLFQRAQSFVQRAEAARSHEVAAAEAALRDEQEGLKGWIQSLDPSVEFGAQFTGLLNGISVRMKRSLIPLIRQLPEVKAVSKQTMYYPALSESPQWMRLPEAWEAFQFGENAGEGVFIAVIDTGVDASHPMFDGEGFDYPSGFPQPADEFRFTNGKIIAAKVFPPSFGIHRGDDSLYDLDGHGTNVASIAAGNLDSPSPLGPISGVAPKAYVGNYKVFTFAGATSEQIVRAVESAVGDGADVINMSLGSSFFDDPFLSAEVEGVRNGVMLGSVIVVAAGNASRAYTIGAPGQVEEVITVAAVNNSHRNAGDISPFSDDKYRMRVSLFVNGEETISSEPAWFGANSNTATFSEFLTPILGAFPLVDADTLDGGSFGGPDDGTVCGSLNIDDTLNGEWMLIQRGGEQRFGDPCFFNLKANFAQEAGAGGVLVYMDEGNELFVDFDNPPGADEIEIPFFLIGREFGLAVKQALQNGDEVVIETRGEPLSSSSFTPNRMATFSSRGPSAEYGFKPDVSAVGAGSFAAMQNDQDFFIDGSFPNSFVPGGYLWIDGTSQATPRVAGLAALVRQRHPDWPVDWVKSAIIGTAKRTVEISAGVPAGPMDTGAGRVDALDAINVDTLAFPAKLSFGKVILAEEETMSRVVRIQNVSWSETYEYAIASSLEDAPFEFALSQERFTLDPQEYIEIDVTATMPPARRLEESYEGRLTVANLSSGREIDIAVWALAQSGPVVEGGVLLVDDDEAGFENVYESMLAEAGYSFTHWDVRRQTEFPSFQYMKKFRSVVWFMGDRSLADVFNPDSNEFLEIWNKQVNFESELQRYLADGGTLLLSGQNYLDLKNDETDSLATEGMGIDSRTIDFGANTIRGRRANPVGGDITELSMNYPDGIDNEGDLIRVNDIKGIAEDAFYVNGSLTRIAGVTIENCNYRAVFLAFPLEAVEGDGGARILKNSLDWLQETSFEPAAISQVEPNFIDLDTMAPEYEITIKGNGFSYDAPHYAWAGSFPLGEVERVDCNTLTATVPGDIPRGVYTLHVTTGNGARLRLPQALTVSSIVQVSDWALR